MARGVYEVHFAAQTISTAITILEVTAPSTAVLEINKAWVSQNNITASTSGRIQLLRKSATITGTATPPTANPLGADGTTGATIKWKATAEGTDGVVIDEQGFNYLNGYLWVPTTPTTRLIIPPSGIIALKFPAAPTSASWHAGFEWQELG
jgi:hypothetical protein